MVSGYILQEENINFQNHKGVDALRGTISLPRKSVISLYCGVMSFLEHSASFRVQPFRISGRGGRTCLVNRGRKHRRLCKQQLTFIGDRCCSKPQYVFSPSLRMQHILFNLYLQWGNLRASHRTGEFWLARFQSTLPHYTNTASY